MTSSPITLWQIEGKKVEAVNILFLGSKITEDGECSHEIKRSCDKPRQCIKKQTHHLANKGPHSQRYGFSSSHVQMWRLDHKEGWAPKNWCFWIMVLEKTLESDLDSRRSNQSVLKEIHPEYSMEGLMLKLQHFGHLTRRVDSFEKTLKLGKIEGRRRAWQGEVSWHH